MAVIVGRTIFHTKGDSMKLTMRATATLGKKVTLITAAFVLAVSTLTAAVPFILSQEANAAASLAYQGIPSAPAGNYPSVGHQAYATSELGDRVQLGGSNRLLKEVAVNFSTWACETGSWNTGDCVSSSAASFALPVKVNLYKVNGDGTAGALITSVNKTLNAKYRPSADVACTGADAGKWSDGTSCFNGLAYTETFDFSSSNTVLPNEVIVGVAYNTSTYGYAPTGVAGPADSFNISLQTAAPVVGTDVDAGTMYRATASSAMATYTGYDGYHLGVNISTDATPAVAPCTATTTVWSTSMAGWNVTPGLDDTRSAGHSVVTGDGVRVYTDNNTSQAKATGYLPVNYALSANGSQTTAQSIDWTQTSGTVAPGLQLVVDFDNNGSADGILVGEPTFYGNNWWLSNGSAQTVKDNAPNNGGGNGSPWYGTLNEWLSKYPTAQVKYVGYSLGSGVLADGTIKRLTFGCVDYRFDNAAPSLPVHESPAMNAVQASNDFWFDWNDVAGATRYEIQNSQSETVNANGSFQNVQWTGDYQQIQPTESKARSVGASGTWYWQVRAIDAAGNASAWTTPWKVTIDQAGPTITVQPSSIGSNGRYSKVGFNFYDANKVDYITINGVYKDLSNNEYSNVDNIGNPYWYGAVEGINTLIAYDLAGNATTLNFVIDRTVPLSVTFTHSNNNDNTLVNTDVTSTLTASEAIQTPAGWTLVEGTGNTKFTKVSSANNKGNLTVADFAGNSKTVLFEVKRIDKTGPVFNIANNTTVTTNSYEVVITEENFGSIVTVDGANVATTGTKPTYRVTVTGEGLHTVAATDKAGNTSTLTFAIDTTGPQITGDVEQTDNVITPAYVSSEPATYVWELVSGDADGVEVSDPTVLNPEFTVVTDGEYEYKLTATDAYGNPTVKTLTFEYTTPVTPTVPVTPTTPVNPVAPTAQEAPVAEADNTNLPSAAGNIAGILGTDTTIPQSTNNTDTNNGEAVEGASSQNNVAQAIDTDSSDGTVLGLAWYWWLLILAGIAAIIWWIVAAVRRRQNQDA